MTQRAAIYARISDDRESKEVGVTDQARQCRALARREKLTVVEVFTENDTSASRRARKPRPEYARLLADAKAGRFSVIIALSASRLTRRHREHEDLIDLAQQHGVRYLFIKSPSFDLNSADGQLVARVLSAADQAEADRISERVSDNVRGRAERGEFHGHPRAYGIADDGRTLVEAEAELIRAWYAHVLSGGSLSGIRTGLARRGVATVSGAAWRTPVIRKILLNPRNAGLRITGDGREHRAPNEAIVDVATWRAAVAVLTAPGRNGNGGAGTARRHLGTGLYRCERCGRTVNIAYTNAGRRVYKCAGCYRQWRADDLDDLVVGLVEGALVDEDRRTALLPDPGDAVDVQALHTEAGAIRANMAALVREFATAKPGATLALVTENVRAGEARLAAIDAELVGVGQHGATGAVLGAADPVEYWRGIEDVHGRQAVVRALMSVTLGAPQRGRAPFDPARFVRIGWRRADVRDTAEVC